MVETHNNLLPYKERSRSVKERRRETKRPRLRLLPWMLIPLVLIPVLTVAGYLVFAQQYQRDKTLSNAAEEHLHTAFNLFSAWSKQPFDLKPVRQAGQEFRLSGVLMSQVANDLHVLPGLAWQIPALGPRLLAVSNLVEAAQGVSQAGVAGCQLLTTLLPSFTNPLSAHGQGLTMAQVQVINQLFPQVRAGLYQALSSADRLQPGDLSFDPRLAKTFAGMQRDLPLAHTALAALSALIPALPTMLGVSQPANYLLEIMDSSELRPGGGFIGNDGLLTLSHGRLTGTHVQDVLLIDKKVKDGEQSIPWPAAYQWLSNYLNVPSWSLRDSNLDGDFPTDARNGEENFDRENGQGLAQGVIAITPALIQHALEITGPIYMPEYNQVVTADNLIDLIHYHQLGAGTEGNSLRLTADGQTSLRKHFTELLAKHFMDHLHHLSSVELGKFVGLLSSSLESKDIQVYFNNPAAEALLEEFHIASSIQAPANDSLFVVDANASGNKANAYILTAMHDQVTLDSAGDAQHDLTLAYAWTQPGQIYGTGFYRDYVRVYVPPGSVLTQQQGWQALGSGKAFGRTVWIGEFRMHYGETTTVHLVWRVPRIATGGAGNAGWQYRYLIQHQAGTHWVASMQVNLETCQMTGVPAAGQRIVNAHQTLWSQTLSKDITLGADYACPGWQNRGQVSSAESKKRLSKQRHRSRCLLKQNTERKEPAAFEAACQ